VAREAHLRLRWDQSSFSAQVRQSADDTRKQFKSASTEIGASLKRGFDAGFDGAKKSLSGLGGQLKSVLGTVATLGGAVSLGEFLRQTIAAEAIAGDLAIRLGQMGRSGESAHSMLALASQKARELNQTTTDVLVGFTKLIDATGDPVFSEAALDSVALFKQSMRLSHDEAVSMVAGLRTGLGATTDQINSEFAPAMRDAISRGMNSSQVAALAPAIIKTMTAIGTSGGKGFTELLGIVNMTKGQLGGVEGALEPIAKLLNSLQTSNLEALGKTSAIKRLKIKFDADASSVENLQKIMGAKGGFDALEAAFGKSVKTAAAFRALMSAFDKQREAALASGKSETQARSDAAEKFASELTRMTASISTESDVRAEAADDVQGMEEKFALAIDRMAQSFMRPEVIDSMDKLAAKLPAFADAVAKAIGFIIENPLLSASMGGAAVAAKGAALPMAGSLLKDWLLPGAMAAGEVQKQAADAAGDIARRAATDAGAGWRSSARAAGATFSTAVGVAAAALAGWEIGSQIYDQVVEPAMSEDIGGAGASRTARVEDAARRAINSGTVEERQQALAAVRKERETIREGSVWTDVVGTAASMFTDTKSPAELRAERESPLIEVEAELASRLKARIALEERLGKANSENAKAVEATVRASRGVRRPAAPMPGSETGT
jgi:hypothetical protein